MPRDNKATEVEPHRSASTSGRVRNALREPVVHFLLLGAAIFLLYWAVSPQRATAPGYRIELTEGDLRQIETGWTVKWKRPPTAAEWRDLINEQVKEEILYREALKLGLDQGDEIVRRRLGQKLEFLAEDVSSLRDPTTTELEAWYGQHAARFALPGRVTFCHVYFSPDRGSADLRARQALEGLKSHPSCQASAVLGDRFPDYDYYANRDPDEVASIFGTQFSRDVFQLQPGAWRGPIQSGLGWHLVLVEGLTRRRVPAFNEVYRAQIESAWLDAQRVEAKRKAFAAMKAKYEVVIPKGAMQ